MENRLLPDHATKELAKRVFADFASHGNLKRSARDHGMDWLTLFEIRQSDPEIEAASRAAFLAAGHALVGDAIDIIDSDEAPKRARVRAETRFKIAERYTIELSPRSTVTHEGTINLLGTRIPDAENVLASTPRTYLTAVIDAEYVDAPALLNNGATDKQSADPANRAAEPNAIDIFAE